MFPFIISIKHWGFIVTCHCRKVRCIIVHLSGLWFATVLIWHQMYTCDICVWGRSRIPRQLICVRLLALSSAREISARTLRSWRGRRFLSFPGAGDERRARVWRIRPVQRPFKKLVKNYFFLRKGPIDTYGNLIGERLVKFFCRRQLFLKSVHFTRVEPYARTLYGHITMCLSLSGGVPKTCFGFITLNLPCHFTTSPLSKCL